MTARAYYQAKKRSVSLMRGRHEALARDILEIHADEYMRAYGYRKVFHELVNQGWIVGRDQVARVMRELGIQGVRRGKHPITTRSLKGTGGRPDLVNRDFTAYAPNRLHVADITYVRLKSGVFAYTAFVTDVFSRRIVGWAVSSTMKTTQLPLKALEQSIYWAVSHGDTSRLVHHSDHGVQYMSSVYQSVLQRFNIVASTGTVGDSYDNAMAESVNGAYKAELIRIRSPFQTVKALEQAPLKWVSWWNTKRLHEALGYKTPAQVEQEFYQEQKTGKLTITI